MNLTRMLQILALWLFLAPVSAAIAYSEIESGSVTVPPAHVNDIFDVANEEYKNGNYEDAITLYKGLLAGTEYDTSDIYYNLGNAYFRLQQYGKAIVSYRRALQRNPRDKDTLANLRHVRNTATDKIDRPRGSEILRQALFFHYDLSKTESELIFLCAYFLTSGAAILHLFLRGGIWKWLSICGIAATVLFGGSTLAHLFRSEHPNEAVVIVNEATVRTGPGPGYMISYYLHDGTEMKIRRRTDDWRQIELPDGRRGWLRKTAVETI